MTGPLCTGVCGGRVELIGELFHLQSKASPFTEGGTTAFLQMWLQQQRGLRRKLVFAASFGYSLAFLCFPIAPLGVRSS